MPKEESRTGIRRNRRLWETLNKKEPTTTKVSTV